MQSSPVRIAAEISLPDGTPTTLPPEINKYKALRLMSESARRTLIAILQASSQAGLDLTILSSTRALVVVADYYDPLPSAMALAKLRQNANPLWLLKTLPNMPASHFAILTKSGGPNHTVANGEQAQQIAKDLIISGEADTVICADIATASAAIFTKSPLAV
jgi:3-oxoacyl-(acyl-carrier-protein) synthase